MPAAALNSSPVRWCDDPGPSVPYCTTPGLAFAAAMGRLVAARRPVAAAKAKPGAVQYGTLGPGSSHHLTGELFSAAAGIEMTQVPYRSDVAGIPPCWAASCR